MRRWFGSAVRRALLWNGLDQYVDGLASADYDVVLSDDWELQAVEVRGRLALVPGLLAGLVDVDTLAHVDFTEGTELSRVVVRLPDWLPQELRRIAYGGATRQDLNEPPPTRASGRRGGSLRPAHAAVSGQGPPGLGLSSHARQLDPIVMELHGLKLHVRTYSESERGALRGKVASDALQRLIGGDWSARPGDLEAERQKASRAASAPAREGEDARQEGQAEPDLVALAKSLLGEVRVEVDKPSARFSSQSGARADVTAERLELDGVMRRPQEDRLGELWFGGDVARPSACRAAVDVKTTGLGLTLFRAVAGGGDDSLALGLIAEEFKVFGMLPAEPGGTGSWRFAAHGANRIDLPHGVGGLEPLFASINEIIAAVVATDVITLASQRPEAAPADEERERFGRLWWRQFLSGRAELLQARGCAGGVIGCGGPCARPELELAPLSEAEAAALDGLIRKLPFAVQVAQLNRGVRPGRWLPGEDEQRLQQNLCEVLDEKLNCGLLQIAVEVGPVKIGLAQEVPARLLAFQDSLSPPAPAARSRRSSFAAERSVAETARALLEISSQAVGVYHHDRPRPRDWCRALQVVVDGLDVSGHHEPVSGGEVPRTVLLLSSQAGGDVEGAGMTALAFKKLVGSDPRAAGAAPLSLRIRSGCFGPEGGEAGPAPWQLRGAQPVPEPARLSSPPGVGDKGGEQVAEDTDQPDSAGLGPWDRVLRFEDARTPARAAGSDLDAAAGEMAPWNKGGNDILGLHVEHAPHPPRTQFVQFTCQSEIKARLSPKWIAVLSLLSQDVSTRAGAFELRADFEHVNFPAALAGVGREVLVKAASLSVGQQAVRGMCLAARLPEGLSLRAEPRGGPRAAGPAAGPSRGDCLELRVPALGVVCTAPMQEVRHVLDTLGPITVSLTRTFAGTGPGPGSGQSSASVEGRVIKLTVTPQLCFTAAKLAGETREALDIIAPQPEDGEGHSAASSSEPDAEEASEPEAPDCHATFVSVDVQVLKVNFCDAIGKLLRLRVALRAGADLPLGCAGGLSTKTSAALRLSELSGEFASRSDSVWEPFLEPWCACLALGVLHDRVRLAVKDGDFDEDDAQTASLLQAMRRESQGSAASAGNEGDLRLNLAPQLVRRAVQLCRELSDPAAVVAAAPGGGRDGPPDGEGLAAEQHRDAPAVHCSAEDSNLTSWSGFGTPPRSPTGSRPPSRHGTLERGHSSCLAAASQECLTNDAGSESMLNPSRRSSGSLINNGPVATQARISAMNLTGQDVALQFFVGGTLHEARDKAREAVSPQFNSSQSPMERAAPDAKREVLRGKASGPTLLDRHIAEPMNTIVAIQLKPSAERADGEMTNTPTVGEMTATPTHVKSMTPCQRTETMQMFAFEDHLLGWPSDPRSPVLPLFGGWGARMATVPTPGADLRQRSRKTTHDNGRLLADAEHSASSPSGSSTRFAVAASEASRHSAVSRISETSLENELSSTEHHWVVQVLVPQPGKRLLVVASSVRVFNYTGRPLYLNYAGNGVQFGGFSEQLVAAATARIDLLGAEQSKLGLSAASVAALLQGPLEEDRGLTGTQASTPDGDDFLWRLPPLHFASPPVPQDAAFRISLTSRISRGGQSQTINPAELARRCESGEWQERSCHSPEGGCLVHFRVKVEQQRITKPHPIEILNVILLPTLSIVNLTPAVMEARVRWPGQSRKARGGQSQKLIPGKTARHHLSAELDSDRSPALHLELKLADVQDHYQGVWAKCEWAQVVTNVCKSCADEPKTIRLPCGPALGSPAVELSCADFVVAISCPYWLVSHLGASLEIAAAASGADDEHFRRFPAFQGITMLDSNPTEVRLFPLLQEAPKQKMRRSESARSESALKVLSSAAGASTRALGTAAGALTAGRLALGEKEWCALPVPVASSTASGLVHLQEQSYEFTVSQVLLPPLHGSPARVTCFQVLPSLVIRNRTDELLHVRPSGQGSTVLQIKPCESKPCYSVQGKKGARVVQLRLGSEDSDAVATQSMWSGSVLCEDSANGRHSLRVRCESSESSTPLSPGLLSVATTNGTRVISVEVSAASEGTRIVTVSGSPCLIAACVAPQVASLTVETDAPAEVVHDSSTTGVLRRNLNLLAKNVEQAARMAGGTALVAGERVAKTARAAGESVAMTASVARASLAAAALGESVQPQTLGNSSRWRARVSRSNNSLDDTPDLEASPTRAIVEGVGSPVRWGFPEPVGWYQPFLNRNKGIESTSVVLHWQQPDPPAFQQRQATRRLDKQWPGKQQVQLNQTVVNGVLLRLCLWSQTPLVVLRSTLPPGTGIMVRVRLRVQQSHLDSLAAIAVKRAADAEHAEGEGRFAQLLAWSAECAGSEQTPEPLDRSPDEVRCSVLQDAWCAAGRGNPDLLEVKEVALSTCVGKRSSEEHDQCLWDADTAKQRLEVQWVCGECGELVNSPDPPSICASCNRELARTRIRARSRQISQDFGSTQIAVRPHLDLHLKLSKVYVSVVSERERQELFLGRLSGFSLRLNQSSVDETGKLVLDGLRVDCQPRMQTAREAQSCLRRTALFFMGDRRYLAQTPAVLCSGEDSNDSFLDFFWSRPLEREGSNSVILKAALLKVARGMELVFDDEAARSILTLRSEFLESASSSDRGGYCCYSEAFHQQIRLVQEDFMEKVSETRVAAELLPVFHIEKSLICRIDVRVWGSVTLAELPQKLMPATLKLVLKVLALSDSISIEGSTLVLKKWALPPFRGSPQQIQGLAMLNYQRSLLHFVAKGITSSNLLPCLGRPVGMTREVVSMSADMVGQLMNTIDLSAIADREYMVGEAWEYVNEMQDLLREGVGTVVEGMGTARELLSDGIREATGVVLNPVEGLRQRRRCLACCRRAAVGGGRAAGAGALCAVCLPFWLLRFAVGCLCCRSCRQRRQAAQEHSFEEGGGSDEPGSASKAAPQRLGSTGGPAADGCDSEAFLAGQGMARTSRSSATIGSDAAKESPFQRTRPALLRAPHMRLPRMLFGDDGVMQPYDEAQAQLQDQLGDLARGVYEVHALWDLGARPRAEQLMLCISQAHIFLVALGSGRTLHVTESARSTAFNLAPTWSFNNMRWHARRSIGHRTSKISTGMSKRAVEQVAAPVEQAASKRTDMRCWLFKDLVRAQVEDAEHEGEALSPGARQCTLTFHFRDHMCTKEVPRGVWVERAVQALNERIDQEGSFDRQ